MKKLLLSLSILAVSMGAFAGEPVTKPLSTSTGAVNVDSQQQQQQESNSAASAVSSPSARGGSANNAGNTQQVIFTSPGESKTTVEYAGTQTLKNVPSMGAPALTTSNNMCVGSVSGALSLPGIGGAFAKTIKDEHCIIIKSSAHLWEKGFRAASMGVDCSDPLMHDMLTITGYDCPQDDPERMKRLDVVKQRSTEVSASATGAEIAPVGADKNGEACYTGNDPIIPSRMKACAK